MTGTVQSELAPSLPAKQASTEQGSDTESGGEIPDFDCPGQDTEYQQKVQAE